jgi:GNAT superfamily N-acetyltransferase
MKEEIPLQKNLTEVSIVQAMPSDIPEIRRLAFAIWPTAYGNILTEKQITYMLDLFYTEEALRNQFLTHQFLLAQMEDETVGFASYSLVEETKRAKLHKLYVVAGLQGKGVGRKFLDAIIVAVSKLGISSLELNVNRYNKAIGFYENYGFRKLREEDIPIGNDFWMNDYVMTLSIER